MFLLCDLIMIILHFLCPQHNEQDLNKKIETVSIISEKEKLTHNGKKIGDIIFKENENPDWNYLKSKMIEFSKLNGANLIEVKTIAS